MQSKLEELSIKAFSFLSLARVIHSAFKKPQPNFQFQCRNRAHLHDKSHTHPHIQAVNQYLDSRNVRLEQDLIGHFEKTIAIDLYPCKNFLESSVQSVKSIKNELKIAKTFLATAQKSPAGSEQEASNRAGYAAHLILGAAKAFCSAAVVIEDMNSCGFGSGVAVEHHINRK